MTATSLGMLLALGSACSSIRGYFGQLIWNSPTKTYRDSSHHEQLNVLQAMFPSPQISCCVISSGTHAWLVSCQHADLSLEFYMMEHLFIHLQYLDGCSEH
jgi:hypothetical protein